MTLERGERWVGRAIERDARRPRPARTVDVKRMVMVLRCLDLVGVRVVM